MMDDNELKQLISVVSEPVGRLFLNQEHFCPLDGTNEKLADLFDFLVKAAVKVCGPHMVVHMIGEAYELGKMKGRSEMIQKVYECREQKSYS